MIVTKAFATMLVLALGVIGFVYFAQRGGNESESMDKVGATALATALIAAPLTAIAWIWGQ